MVNPVHVGFAASVQETLLAVAADAIEAAPTNPTIAPTIATFRVSRPNPGPIPSDTHPTPERQ
jgi:hypothetical protein